jgi:hypothetical protein
MYTHTHKHTHTHIHKHIYLSILRNNVGVFSSVSVARLLYAHIQYYLQQKFCPKCVERLIIVLKVMQPPHFFMMLYVDWQVDAVPSPPPQADAGIICRQRAPFYMLRRATHPIL